MDTISSAEFRKTYARLTDHTEVTVNGHVIGRWSPVNAPLHRVQSVQLVADEDAVEFGLGTADQQAIAAERIAQGKPGATLVEPSAQARRDAILHKINKGG